MSQPKPTKEQEEALKDVLEDGLKRKNLQ